MARQSVLRFAAQTDEVTSLLRIVNLVRNEEATTRPEIGRVTGLGRGVVTQRLDDAISAGLLEDAEYGPSSGGRAPRVLRFRAERGLIAVCAFGALHINVGLGYLSGDVFAQSHREWDIARGPAETIETALQMLDELIAEVEEVPVWAVAVGVPGLVDFLSGRLVAPPIMPGWNGFNVRRRFEKHFAAPVWVDNDANLLVLSERARRFPEPNLDLIYCKIGSGVGAGLLSHGRIHRGADGSAGDIGHIRVAGSAEVCRCGRVGCLEAVVGGWALVRDAERALDEGAAGILGRLRDVGEQILPEAIAGAATDGDALAHSLVQQSARVMGESIAALVNMFNPRVIVIGGAIAAAGEIYLAEVRQRIYEISHPLATRNLSIVNSPNDIREPLRGGLEMVREQLFEVSFGRWYAAGRPQPELVVDES